MSKENNNSKYFHSKATKRFSKSSILGIKDTRGEWQNKPDEIGKILIDFYSELFTTSNPVLKSESLDFIPIVVSIEMNAKLTGDFMEWELLYALRQMAPLKTLGSNGMPPLFYQHFWPVVNHELTQSILAWLNSGTLPYLVNHTFITLIPKVDSPEQVSEYHPISLCNVLYKILAKIQN